MASRINDYFEGLSANDIRKERPGKWGDYDLLDVLGNFSEVEDRERATAVLELIFASPDHNDQMVDYDGLYQNAIYDSLNENDFTTAAYWAVAAIAYNAQHFLLSESREEQYALFEIYLLQGNIDAGLALAARLLQTDPADLWVYNRLSFTLPRVGLPDLALDVVDRALLLAKIDDPYQLTKSLRQQRDDLVKERETAVSPPAIQPDILTQFHHALTLLPADAQKYASPIADLLEAGEELDENLRREIELQAEALLPELIQLAFDNTYWGTAVTRHAITLLRQIHTTRPALDSLARWLDQATDENWYKWLSIHVGKIGGYAPPELQAMAVDTRLELFVRINAVKGLLEQTVEFPEQRPETITFLRTLFTREEAYRADEELFIAFLVSAVTDGDAKELYPEIKQVFDEDRLDPTVIDLPFIHQQWDMEPLPRPERREDGLYLMLECKQCGRNRQHFVQHVTVDLNTHRAQLEGEDLPYDSHIMDRPITCPKCGAVDQYKTDAITRMRLMIGDRPEHLMAFISGEQSPSFSPLPFVSQVRTQAFGRAMHPLVALDKYKLMAMSNPKQAEPHWRMGNVLRMIWRDEQAREEYQWALKLDPKDPWVHYALGATEHDLGNLEEAKALYQKAIRLISPLDMLRDEELMSASMTAADGLKALKKGLPSPYAQDNRYPEPEKPKKLSRKERWALKKKNKKRWR
jgi:tetratricopeptide (TPR) repeat protein